MFDSICIHHPQKAGLAFDLGFLAEAMVFYRRVRVLVSATELESLLRICGPDSLCAALESGLLEIAYIKNYLGVSTFNAGLKSEQHGLVFVTPQKREIEEYIYDKILVWINNRGKTSALIDRLVRHVTTIQWENPAASDARSDLLDIDFCNAVARASVEHLTGGYVPPDGTYFRVRLADSIIEQPGYSLDLSIETNFDFKEASAFYQRVAPGATLNKETVLSGLFAGLADLKTAASFSDEMAVSPTSQAIAGLKLQSLLSKRAQSDQKINVFQDWTCEHGRAIREAVAAKHYNFDDILRLAEQARPFKDWLAEHPDSSDLNKEYLRAVGSVGWAERLPPKLIRFLLFTGLGGGLGFITNPREGLATTVILNSLDSFLIDRLVKSWKPNQFVDGPLKSFVK